MSMQRGAVVACCLAAVLLLGMSRNPGGAVESRALDAADAPQTMLTHDPVLAPAEPTRIASSNYLLPGLLVQQVLKQTCDDATQDAFDFTAAPASNTSGAPVTVSFTFDTSALPQDTRDAASQVVWFPRGSGGPQTTVAVDGVFEHQYTAAGVYQVCALLIFADNSTCPPDGTPVCMGTYIVTAPVDRCAGVDYDAFTFTIDPDNGAAPLTVTFTPDQATLPADATQIEWFPEGVNSATTVVQNLANQDSVEYTYEEEGTFDICVRFTIRPAGSNAFTCPPTNQNPACVNVITVGGEDVPAADLTFEELVRGGEALLPLTDWVPLFQFSMGYSEDEFAPRILQELVYSITGDDNDPELPYLNLGSPEIDDLLEFGLFEESFSDGDDDKNLDATYDTLLFTWDNRGAPYGTVNGNGPMTYRITFADAFGNPTVPDPIVAAPATDASIEGNSYIVAVRTSATWRTHITLRPIVSFARMVVPAGGDNGGEFPTDDEGAPVDSYSPDFFEGENLDPDESYSSSFTVWETTGTPIGREDPIFFDAWNWPKHLQTNEAEFTRPRWNQVGQLVDYIAAEFVELRKVLSYEQWYDLVGINVHSTKAVHFGDEQTLGFGFDTGKSAPVLREVNVVLTDIGADPYAERGNGGFDPRNGLDNFSPADNVFGAPVRDSVVTSTDISFNGVWVWHDTNGNGLFDPPTQLASGGIDYNDKPLFGEGFFLGVTAQQGSFEYIPFPPGGGDPWWKIKLRFFGGARRASYDVEDDIEGHVELVPDTGEILGIGTLGDATSAIWNDYFVTIRPDSGFLDVSLGTPDGTGMTPGADLRAFIEPRRFNALTGSYDGGIHVSSQLTPEGLMLEPNVVESPWQDDPRWGVNEPWWNQRTVNQESTKPVKANVQVNDLVLTYEPDSEFAQVKDKFFFDFNEFFGVDLIGAEDNLFVSSEEAQILGYNDPLVDNPPGPIELSGFDEWMDPFGLRVSQFRNLHTVGIGRWALFGSTTFSLPNVLGEEVGTIAFSFDETIESQGQFAFETVPFLPVGEAQDDRSDLYPQPPPQPEIPNYATWPATLEPGEYPRLSNWPEENQEARLLYQKVDTQSIPTAMLGINLTGADDVIVNNRTPLSVAQIRVAFWGPNFQPSDLLPLDDIGEDVDSGIQLWEDADGDGTFLGRPFYDVLGEELTLPLFFDAPVSLRDLRWPAQPELIDLDGDGIPDDMNGDAVVDSADRAWVVDLIPAERWVVPFRDEHQFNLIAFKSNEAGEGTIAVNETKAPAEAGKALSPEAANGGDDLFITVRTSDKISRFEGFRAVIPARLPTRVQESDQAGGILFFPQLQASKDAFIKQNPDEWPVQPFYGHDMLEANVGVKLVSFGSNNGTIYPGGPTVPVLGIDASTNRTQGTVAQGTNGVGAPQLLTVPGANWAADAFVGDFLIDENYEQFEIVGNTNEQLELLSGQPKDGSWRIASEPSFLEEVVVEFYAAESEFGGGFGSDFNPRFDFLPLQEDQRVSGVAIYRDNDFHPLNRNGVFDAGIDIPLTLDDRPSYVGLASQNNQVKFVFSSPGTDDLASPEGFKPLADQPRLRQWVPDTFGSGPSDPNTGAEFFIVVRAASTMDADAAFRAGIVSWGPNTPTEPDPDTWSITGVGVTEQTREEFAKFREFPWATRGAGFITFFDEPQVQYYLDETVAGQRVDNSGFNWLRSHNSKKLRSNTYTARDRSVGPRTLVISGTSLATPPTRAEIPMQLLDGQEFTFVIRGQGFGTIPQVVLSDYNVRIITVTDTAISVAISNKPGVAPQEPIVLLVTNPETGDAASRSDLFTLVQGTPTPSPNIAGVSPDSGTKEAFPVVLSGTNFVPPVQVRFGQTLMPVNDVSADGTRITVGYPISGIAIPGVLDVSVVNLNTGKQDTLINAFEFINNVNPDPTAGCGPSATGSGGLGDILLMAGLLCALLAGSWRRGSARQTANE